MEETGAQVASPISLHQTLNGKFYNSQPMAKKRHLPFPSNFVHQNTTDNWNPNLWQWDSTRFVAKPSENHENRSQMVQQVNRDVSMRMEVRNGGLSTNKGGGRIGDDDGNLVLKLGGEMASVSRPNKRVRPGSPGSGPAANYPMCQVDNCKEDLSKAKDYHRRHKVCEVHSKATKALVGKQMQRFCQQCSRFHPLSEFDEGKRSCRRRLAGHNRRRRKTQQEEAASAAVPRVLDPCARENNVNCDMDIVNLLAVLASAKGNTEDKSGKIFATDKDQLIQILSKINSTTLQANQVGKPPRSKITSPSHPSHVSCENQKQSNVNVSSPSTKDLLAVLSSSPTPPYSDNQSQPSTEGSDSDKGKSPIIDQTARVHSHKGPDMQFRRMGGERSSPSYHSPMEDADSPLQLFSSSPEEESKRKLPSYRNYLSSHSSSEDRSPMASPPVVHNLFPMQTSKETRKQDVFSTSDDVAYVKATMNNGCSTTLKLFGSSIRPAENGSFSPNQAGYASSSGSDHSPSSLSSDAQDRTGRISFKLFDKDPSHLPVSLRNQVYNWLSSGPSEMESYIRPGCIVLSLYLSMSTFAWDHLEENLQNYVISLIKEIDVDFWGNGRFVVHTDRQMASHKDGKIRLCKSWGGWSLPELISVSPVAIVAGKETSLLLKGKSLTTPGTKINCTLAAEYNIRTIQTSSHLDSSYDEISLDGFKTGRATSSVLGRIFIEVENGTRGTYFPVIIADNTICRELRLLEPEIAYEMHDGISTNQMQNRERLEILHFLEEIGWLFQRKHNSSLFDSPGYRVHRFKFLLIFSVDHGFCALVKTILDILLELNMGRDELISESLEMLSEIHLLNRAVRIKSRSMVDLLTHYSVTDPTDSSKTFLFVPSMAGPGGITPLHLAACTSFSDDIVDSLTSDPQQVGLQCWDSVLDANGLSPHAYASMRNNISYNALVAQKLLDRQNGQISLSIENSVEQLQSKINDKKTVSQNSQKSCSRCAVAANGYSKSFPGSNGLLQRPYLHSMLMVAAVCVCVCLFLRGHPYVGCVSPFAWENLSYGAI